MENTYKENKIGRLVAWIVAAILLITAVGAIVVFAKKDTPDTQTTFQDGMTMTVKPSIRLSEPQGVRFTAVVTPELYNEVTSDENKDFGMVIAPLNYYMKVDVGENTGDCDWLKLFEEEDLTVITMDNITPYAVTESDGTLVEYRFNGSITNILYKNTNLQFLGIGYVKTTDGENVGYKYASFADGLLYKQCAYSYAYVAAERLNAYVVSNEYLAQSDLDILNGVINSSVDYVNGLETATEDNSTYAVTLSETEKTLKVGETFTLKTDIAEGVKVPVWWQSSDQSVATVKDGVVTALKNGTTTISAVVAGKKYTCLVTVGETQAQAVVTE